MELLTSSQLLITRQPTAWLSGQFKSLNKDSLGDKIQERISRFLFKYRISQHATTGVVPSVSDADLTIGIQISHNELRIGNNNRSRITILQHHYAFLHWRFSVRRELHIGSLPKWWPGTVTEVTGLVWNYNLALLSVDMLTHAASDKSLWKVKVQDLPPLLEIHCARHITCSSSACSANSGTPATSSNEFAPSFFNASKLPTNW
jgi:hypothetical protein